MVIGEAIGQTDVAVLGGGPGGYVAAIELAKLGRKVTVIDRESVGGICLHHGCIPTKGLIHAATRFKQLNTLEHMGISVENLSLDFTKTQEWKRGVVSTLDGGIRAQFKQHGVQLLKANAFFEESNKLALRPVNEGEHLELTALEFNKCIIAAGSTERELPTMKFDGQAILDSTRMIEIDHIPESLIVVGGGYIGIELSQVFAKLGTKVTIVEYLPRILAQIDEDCVGVIERELKESGVDVITGAKVLEGATVDGKAKVVIEKDGNKQELFAEKAVVAIGRRPLSDQLSLDRTKVTIDKHGFIQTDNQMRTKDNRIFAVGDIRGGVMLAHKAEYEGKVAAHVICGNNDAFDNFVPYAIFSEPEIAGVGINEQDAKKQGMSYKVTKTSMAMLGKAHIMGDTHGFYKVIYNKDEVLGIHIVGPRASDLIGEACLAMEMGANVEDIALTIHPHPTLVEGYKEVCGDAADELFKKG